MISYPGKGDEQTTTDVKNQRIYFEPDDSHR